MYCNNFKSDTAMGIVGSSRLYQPKGEYSSKWAFGKPRITTLIITAAVAILSLGLVACKNSNASVPKIVTEVLVAQPVQRDVPLQSEWVATLDGYVNAEIRPRSPGTSSAKTTKKARPLARDRPCSKSTQDPSNRALALPRESLLGHRLS